MKQAENLWYIYYYISYYTISYTYHTIYILLLYHYKDIMKDFYATKFIFKGILARRW